MKPLCVVSCPIDTFSGYGARSRDFVRSLIKEKDSEWDIRIIPQRWGDCPWNFLPKDDPLRKRFIGNLQQHPDIWMMITVPNEFQPVGKFNVGISAGIETTLYPADFLEGSNRMDLNLVSSYHSKNVALQTNIQHKNDQGQVIKNIKLEKPIEVLFEGLDLDKYYKEAPALHNNDSILDDVDEEFCFLYTGHWLPGEFGEDRKNTGLMIKTFLETFNTPSKKKPALILKTNHVNYSLMDRVEILKKINGIKSQIKGNLPNIYLLHGEMTDAEMNELNNDPKVKAFVSFTKGEGFGRPLSEAAITGKPVITTNWSGHIDFLHPDYNILIGGELKNVHESAANQFLLKDSQWFNINPAIAGRAMKDVFNHYKKYIEKSRKQTQYIKENFSFDKMGELLKNILDKNIISQVPINLPKLKKIELPKLKKVEA
jgi:glycosyltransferase involved in cell wall biosynthesis